MFTGIVQAVGRIATLRSTRAGVTLAIEAKGALRGCSVGDSIAVNGVCLTATTCTPNRFTADLTRETLDATTAGSWKAGTRVNLEKALTPSTPLGGHLVIGHVDGVGKLIALEPDGNGRRLRFEAPRALARYIARKGSICVDGVSLTVNEVAANRFDLMIIPHTLKHTTLGSLERGAAVNLEVDLIARYLERLLAARESQ